MRSEANATTDAVVVGAGRMGSVDATVDSAIGLRLIREDASC